MRQSPRAGRTEDDRSELVDGLAARGGEVAGRLATAGRAAGERLAVAAREWGRRLDAALREDPLEGARDALAALADDPRESGHDLLVAHGPSRRGVLTLLGGATLGAAATSPGAVADVLGPLNPFDGPARLDPSATEGPPNPDVMALVRDGKWSNAGTWRGDGTPGDGAHVVVEEGVTVRVTHQDAARLKTVRVDGRLVFEPTSDTHLQVETLVTTPGSLLAVGTPERPVKPDAEARITFVDQGPIDEDADPKRLGKGLLTMGALSLNGAAKTTWSTLSRAPRMHDGRLELAEAPDGWRAGDRVVVPGTSPTTDQDEEALVTGVDGTTVHLDRTLDHDHRPAADDFDTYVLNLSRNVRLVSENADVPRRGHLMFMSDVVDVRYAGAYHLGRTDKTYPFTNPAHGTPPSDVPPNPRARYAVHFHRTGVATETPARVEGCAVWGSPGWGIVNHHSHVDVVDCVTYDVAGSGFVAEAGNERGSFVGNFALRSTGSGEVPDSRAVTNHGDREGDVDDFGHGGHGFWFQGPAVVVEDNVAAGHRHYGFVYWNRPLVDRQLRTGEEIDDRRGTVANFPVEYLEGQDRLAESDLAYDGKVPSSYVRLRSFVNNTAFASGGGLEISRHMFGYDHTRFSEYGVVEGFMAHDIGPLVREGGRVLEPHVGNAQGGNSGLTIRYSHNLLVRDAHLHGGGRSDVEGATGGVGLNRNVPYPFNVVVADSVVEGFDRGVEAFTRGLFVLERTRLDNRVNVEIHRRDRHPPRKIAMSELTFAGGRTGVDLGLASLDHLHPHELFGGGGGVTLDGRSVYLDEQRPDHVPVPTETALEKLGHGDDLRELTGGSPSAVVGKTNRQLHREFGLAVGGELLPDSAVRDPRVSGGFLEAPDAGSRPEEIWLEAEAGDLEDPFRVEPDPDASGGEYVVPRGVDSHREPPDAGYATYEFEAAAGEYEIHGRVRADDWSDDSFWLRIDRGEWLEWDGLQTREEGWQWRVVEVPDGDRPATFALDAGRHTLQVAFREDGARLDKLLVAADGTTPIGLGEPVGEG